MATVTRRTGEIEVAEVATILIAVGDTVLADSLRFSLELEGYAAKLCDELSLFALTEDEDMGSPGCLVIDQDVFIKLTGGDGRMALIGMPVVLMVGQKTKRLIDRAKAAGVTHLVEKPLVGGVLLDEIRDALDDRLDF
jgi:FixJ family two-component response regulator